MIYHITRHRICLRPHYWRDLRLLDVALQDMSWLGLAVMGYQFNLIILEGFPNLNDFIFALTCREECRMQ